MTEAVKECAQGLITTEATYENILTICSKYVLDETQSEELTSTNLRKLFSCNSATINVDAEGVDLTLKITFPNIIAKTSLNIHTVPVFKDEEGKNTTIKQMIITDDIIFKTKEGYKAFTNCERRGGLRLCNEQCLVVGDITNES